MSSYNQIIVNELILRTAKDQVTVIFEPRSHPFPFGRPRISLAPLTSRDQVNAGGFFRHGTFLFSIFSSHILRKDAQFKMSSLLTENASEETRKALDEADQDLDEIAGLLVRFLHFESLI